MTTFLKKTLLTTCVRSVLILSIAAPSFAGGPDNSTNPFQQQQQPTTQQQQQQEATTTEPTTTATTEPTTTATTPQDLEQWRKKLIEMCKNQKTTAEQIVDRIAAELALPEANRSSRVWLPHGRLRTLKEMKEWPQQELDERISLTPQELDERISLAQQELDENDAIDRLNYALRVLMTEPNYLQYKELYQTIISRLEALKKKQEQIAEERNNLWEQIKKMNKLFPEAPFIPQPLFTTLSSYRGFFNETMKTLEGERQQQFNALCSEYLEILENLYVLQQQQPQQATTESTASPTTTTTRAAAASLTQPPTSPTTTLSSTTTTVQRPQQSVRSSSPSRVFSSREGSY